MSFRFLQLPAELRNKIYEYIDGDDTTPSIHTGTIVPRDMPRRTVLPNLARKQDKLRNEYLPIYVRNRPLIIDLFFREDRDQANLYLPIFNSSVIINARDIRIGLNDDDDDFFPFRETLLHICLGRYVEQADHSYPSAGSAHIGNVHVVFDSMRTARDKVFCCHDAYQLAVSDRATQLHHTNVATQVAAAIVGFSASRQPSPDIHITGDELRQLLRLLNNIHGVKIDGIA
jgi:hypothetical protein